MRVLIAAVLVAVFASSATAGPLDTLQYRTTLRTDRPTTIGPASIAGTAYLLSDSPTFGVVASSVSGWTPVSPAYPSAGFANVVLGQFAAFTTAGELSNLELEGGGRYALDLEIRDAAGRVGVLSFAGQFEAAWGHGSGGAWPVFDTGGAPPFPVPPSGSVWLGGTRYDVLLNFGWSLSYQRGEDGQWFEGWWPVDSVPLQDGGYWTQASGDFFVTITTTPAPEPGTLALAGIGLCLALVVRRRLH